MPPKPKFTKEEIVKKALAVVAKGGSEALTAQSLGEALGSSARPIFTVFKSMKEVRDEVYAAAMHRFEDYTKEGEGAEEMPLFKTIGMQMIRFGMQEPKLFQLLFMTKNHENESFEDIYRSLGTPADVCIQAIERDYGLESEKAGQLFESMWIFTFGIGALCATGVCRFSEEKIGEMLSTQFRALMLSFGEKNKE